MFGFKIIVLSQDESPLCIKFWNPILIKGYIAFKPSLFEKNPSLKLIS